MSAPGAPVLNQPSSIPMASLAEAQPQILESESLPVPGKSLVRRCCWGLLTEMPTVEHTDHEYLHYTPSPVKGCIKSFAHAFRKIGFLIDAASEEKRDLFAYAMRVHVNLSKLKFQRWMDNEVAFGTMVSNFLASEGEKFWGLSDRSHLEEKDATKGFLCPRDAIRQNSRSV